MKRHAMALAALLLGGCTRDPTGTPTKTDAPGAPSAPAPAQAEAQAPKADAANPCLIQDGEELHAQPVRALGTEPFWSARTEGRCVTYSTPEDQKGTRIWTHVDTGPQGPLWNGALHGRQFQLYVKPSTGCSDGMSDKGYPLDAVLRVDGETRRGCAEPL